MVHQEFAPSQHIFEVFLKRKVCAFAIDIKILKHPGYPSMTRQVYLDKVYLDKVYLDKVY